MSCLRFITSSPWSINKRVFLPPYFQWRLSRGNQNGTHSSSLSPLAPAIAVQSFLFEFWVLLAGPSPSYLPLHDLHPHVRPFKSGNQTRSAYALDERFLPSEPPEPIRPSKWLTNIVGKLRNEEVQTPAHRALHLLRSKDSAWSQHINFTCRWFQSRKPVLDCKGSWMTSWVKQEQNYNEMWYSDFHSFVVQWGVLKAVLPHRLFYWTAYLLWSCDHWYSGAVRGKSSPIIGFHISASGTASLKYGGLIRYATPIMKAISHSGVLITLWAPMSSDVWHKLQGPSLVGTYLLMSHGRIIH